jgi:glycosyltransferase involved in cell wall biosynthesis
LESIRDQEYPKEKIEIIIADGGSTDNTLEISKGYTSQISCNPLRTGEAGKAIGVKEAKNEIIALIDSDNILPQKDWLLRMVEPFADAEIVGTEPLYYTYREQDSFITRYCALLGMNDPLCLFLGNYDRYSTLTEKWTEMPVKVNDMGNYLKVQLHERNLPTIGANGFLVRRSELAKCSIEDYLFDIDVVYELVHRGHDKFGKVKIGIVHIFGGNIGAFIRKQRRRIKDYMYYEKKNLRKYPWSVANKKKLLLFALHTLLTLPLLISASRGYLRKKDVAWLFHIPACWITLWTYASAVMQSKLKGSTIADRDGWNKG